MAIYKDGVLITDQGAVTVTDTSASSPVPSTANKIPGSAVPFGKMVSTDGALYVRFI